MALSFFSIVKRKKDKKNEARIKPLSLSLSFEKLKNRMGYTHTQSFLTLELSEITMYIIYPKLNSSGLDVFDCLSSNVYVIIVLRMCRWWYWENIVTDICATHLSLHIKREREERGKKEKRRKKYKLIWE